LPLVARLRSILSGREANPDAEKERIIGGSCPIVHTLARRGAARREASLPAWCEPRRRQPADQSAAMRQTSVRPPVNVERFDLSRHDQKPSR
jgi:hypothetical protein